ncbi:hypothetical protein MWU60_13530 [Yoonia sp. F2084L]|uniref:hypothetical protein n=1 Tax=Yoonia sp. F2084L TaxID=2926419 RepID=UPI001FF632F5|nr:hypothetical protein [Yoonia sp. F2084L]MCK0096596.1 hypothetical protein [Yoonia sp. F2084L]
MGPIRRRLIWGAALLSPTSAFAEVCSQERPSWDGLPVTALGEFLILMQTPVVLLLIVVTALVIRFRSEWGGLIVVVGWSLSTYLVIDWAGTNPIRTSAINEGCIGNPALFIVVAAAVCIGVVLYTAPLKRGNKSGDQ